MKYNVKALVQAAILLAICIVSQVFKNMSVYFTGSIINTCLIICVFTAGLGWAVILSVITPVTSFFITGSPIMAAIPLIIPCVMIGNIILVVCVKLLKDKPNRRVGTPLSMVVGSVLKALFMGGVIAMVIVVAVVVVLCLEVEPLVVVAVVVVFFAVDSDVVVAVVVVVGIDSVKVVVVIDVSVVVVPVDLVVVVVVLPVGVAEP